jgi:hypothetical protein
VRFRLPVSQVDLRLRTPTGSEDVHLLGATESATEVALWLLSVLACPTSDEVLRWEELTITDVDAAMLALRKVVLGGTIQSTMRCACGEAIDIAFEVDEYLEQHRPRAEGKIAPGKSAGWWALDGTDGTFRIPTVGDWLAIEGHRNLRAELVRRCLQPSTMGRAAQRRMETAMEALAPNLAGSLQSVCPGCRGLLRIAFDPQRYVLRELRQRAAFVLEEVHLIASRYGWSERQILELPQPRRARYAELAHEMSFGV